MEAELVSIDRSLLTEEENSLKFELLKDFTDNHQIDLLSVDKQKGEAVFYTQSFRAGINYSDNYLIDTVSLIKIRIDSDGKLF